MAVTVIPSEFGNAFSQTFATGYRSALERADEERKRKDMIQSLTAMSGANDVLPPSTTMKQTQVQTPTSEIPGQSGITTQPSEPVQAPTTQPTTAVLFQADPYKEGLNAIKKSYAEKMKATLPQMRDPRIAAQFIHQATTERDMAIAEHNSMSFQQDLMGLMQDNGMTPMQKAQAAMGLNAKYKTGLKPNEILKMFETEKPDLRTVGNSLIRVNRDGSVNPLYVAPEKEKAGTWITQTLGDGSTVKINSVTGQTIPVKASSDIMIQTPFGAMKNSDLLAKIEAARPKETVITDDLGNKITKRDGNPEIYNALVGALKAYQEKNKPASPPPQSGGVDLNNLTPAQMEVAKNMKAAGYSRDEIAAALNKTGE